MSCWQRSEPSLNGSVCSSSIEFEGSNFGSELASEDVVPSWVGVEGNKAQKRRVYAFLRV